MDERSAALQRLRENATAVRHEAVRQFAARTPHQPLTADRLRALHEQVEALSGALSTAVREGRAEAVLSATRAAADRAREMGLALGLVRILLETLGQAIRELLGEEVWRAVQPPLDAGLAWLHTEEGSAVLSALPGELLLPGQLAQSFMEHGLQGDRLAAQQLVFGAMDQGMTIRDVYVKVFQPSLYEIGRLWEIGRVSIAQEHLATAITQSVLSALYARVQLETSLERQAVVACLTGNHHDIGPRMVADFLQMAGFNTRFLGANTPQDELLSLIQQVRPDVIGLPATTSDQVDPVRQAIAQVRSEFASYRPTVMVGGLAFNAVEGLWRAVQADVWGEDAGLAIDRLVGSTEWV